MTMALNHTTNLRIRFKKSLSSALGKRSALFVRFNFLWVLYLSILGGVFVVCQFWKKSSFSYGIIGGFFRWKPYLLGVSDSGVFVFL